MATAIRKIGLVVGDVRTAVTHYRELLGIDGWEVAQVDTAAAIGEFRVDGVGVELRASIAWVEIGGIELELIEPRDQTSEFALFLQRYGPGVHHIELTAADPEKVCDHLDTAGLAETLSADVLGSEFRLFKTTDALGVSVAITTTRGLP